MRRLLLLLCLLLVGCAGDAPATVTVQPTPAATQTPVVIVVVVTATPEPTKITRAPLAATSAPSATASATMAAPILTSSPSATAVVGTPTRRPTRTVTPTGTPSPTKTPYVSPTPCTGAAGGIWFSAVFTLEQQIRVPAYYLSTTANGSGAVYQQRQALVLELVAQGRALSAPAGPGYDYAEDDWRGALDNYELLAKADMGDRNKSGYFTAAEKAYAKARDEFDAVYQTVCPRR